MSVDMDDDDEETQWTASARERYLARGEEFIAALRAHLELTAARAGRQAERVGYHASGDRLHEAASAFNEAEFDWCGSRMLQLNEEEEDSEEDVEHDAFSNAQVLSVVGRREYRIVDRDALIAAGRDAYLRCWPQDTDEDAHRCCQPNRCG